MGIIDLNMRRALALASKAARNSWALDRHAAAHCWLVPLSPAARCRHASSGPLIRIALVGTGWDVPALHRTTDLIAIADPDEERRATLEELGREHNVPVFTKAEDLLRNTCRPDSYDSIDNPSMLDVQCVLISSNHFEVGISAVRHGLDVCVEPPTNSEAASKLQEAEAIANEQGTTFVVASKEESISKILGALGRNNLLSK